MSPTCTINETTPIRERPSAERPRERLRHLGAHALIPDNSRRSRGYKEVNLNLGYKVTPRLRVQVDVFNLFDSKDDAADYFYADRLPGEPAEGVEDIHVHPLEPRSARIGITARF